MYLKKRKCKKNKISKLNTLVVYDSNFLLRKLNPISNVTYEYKNRVKMLIERNTKNRMMTKIF